MSCIEEAASAIKGKEELKEVSFEIRQGTGGEPGSPDMIVTCLKRNDECHIFIADISVDKKFNKIQKWVNQKPDLRERPNENVMYELGRADDGSIEKESGKSYTQKEYEYAVEQGIPVLRFVHEDIKRLTGDKLEDTDEGKRKLKEFTDEAKKKMCKFWTTPGELAAQVVLSLTSMIKTNPRIGWIKGDVMTSEKSNSEIIRLKDENEELRAKIKKMEESAPAGIEDLSQGDDLYAVHFDYVKTRRGGYEEDFEDGSEVFSWNQIFSVLSPHLLIECNEITLELLFGDFVRKNADSSFGRITKVYSDCFQDVKVQFIALGLIQESQRKKSAGKVHKYWTLTPYGNKIMMQLKAIKKLESDVVYGIGGEDEVCLESERIKGQRRYCCIGYKEANRDGNTSK